MKRYILIVLSFVFLCIACYKDHSGNRIVLLPSIQIEGDSAYQKISCHQFSRLHLEPEIYRKGIVKEKLQCKWEIKSKEIDRVIGRQAVLDTLVTVPPASDPYSLLLTVTDETTGISAFRIYKLTVLPVLGEGLIVADTKDGGVSTDLTLIQAGNFADNLGDSLVIRRNLYSQVNGEAVVGRVTGLQNINIKTNRTLTIFTPADIFRIDPYSYAGIDRGKEMFIIPPMDEEMLPQSIYYLPTVGAELLLMNGHLYVRGCQGTNKTYSYYTVTDDMTDYYATQLGPVGGLYNFQANMGGFLFDGLGQRRILALNITGQGLRRLKSGSTLFDPNHIGEKSCLYMGETKGRIMNLVMKDDKQAHYEIYSLRLDQKDNGTLPCGRYDVSSCPDIAFSRYYEFSTVEDVFYYATVESVYAAEYIQGIPVTYKRYTVEKPESETITSIDLWRWNGKVVIPSFGDPTGKATVNAKNRMLVVTTYDEVSCEGKVVCLPIEALGAGGIVTDPAYYTVYKGFGRILAVGNQEN